MPQALEYYIHRSGPSSPGGVPGGDCPQKLSILIMLDHVRCRRAGSAYTGIPRASCLNSNTRRITLMHGHSASLVSSSPLCDGASAHNHAQWPVPRAPRAAAGGPGTGRGARVRAWMHTSRRHSSTADLDLRTTRPWRAGEVCAVLAADTSFIRDHGG